MSDCKIFDEYEKWFDTVYLPQLKRFLKHVAECKDCQQKFIEARDPMALELLKITDEGMLRLIKEAGESAE